MKFIKSVFEKNYSFNYFRHDLIAGTTVAIIAIPLALAFGVASSVGAAAGLYSAIIAGLFAAIFGGSRFQVSGPTGGMVAVLVLVVSQYGIEKTLVAGLMAGIILVIFGLAKLGKLIKFIPFSVITGFTAGIAFVIVLSQKENIAAAPYVALATIACSIVIRKFAPRLPVSLLALVIVSFGVYYSGAHVPLLGPIPTSLPMPKIPSITLLDIKELFKPALILAALGAIESLLSAVVADGMTVDEHHDSDKELIGQGIGNIAAPLFGGIAATGAIARTAVNISSGAKTRMAAVIHSIIILVLMLVLAPIAKQIPIAALSGILIVAAFRMIEWENIILLAKSSKESLVIAGLTLSVTILVDLVAAIEVGMIAATSLFVYRMSNLGIYQDGLLEDQANSCEIRPQVDSSILTYRIDGPLFFGTAERFVKLATAHPNMRILILRMRRVPMIDTTGIVALQKIHIQLKRHGAMLFLSGLQDNVEKRLSDVGFIDELGAEKVFHYTRDAMLAAQELVEESESPHGGLKTTISPKLS